MAGKPVKIDTETRFLEPIWEKRGLTSEGAFDLIDGKFVVDTIGTLPPVKVTNQMLPIDKLPINCCRPFTSLAHHFYPNNQLRLITSSLRYL